MPSPRLSLGGSVIVTCFHGRVKREFDHAQLRSPDYPHEVSCLCCENAFRSQHPESKQLCKVCSPKILEGVDRIG